MIRTVILVSLVLAGSGCTGGVFVQYPGFTDNTCGTCASDRSN